jgi:hypothetical protein
MKFRVLLLAAAGLLVLSAPAEAIYGPYAVRQIKSYVKEDCHSYPGFDCLGWEVDHCYKISRRKVRCSSRQEYTHHGNWRECRFKTSAIESRDRRWITLHFGRAQCYSQSGALIR